MTETYKLMYINICIYRCQIQELSLMCFISNHTLPVEQTVTKSRQTY